MKQKKPAAPTVEAGQVWQSKTRGGYAWVTWVGIGRRAKVCWRAHDTTAAPLSSAPMEEFLARFELTNARTLVIR